MSGNDSFDGTGGKSSKNGKGLKPRRHAAKGRQASGASAAGNKGVSRRGVLLGGAAGVAAGALGGRHALAGQDKGKGAVKVRPPAAFSRQAEVPGFAKARIVVVGGGWFGLEAARQLRKLKPDVDVVLIEKRASFFSCPLSNLWLVDKLPLDALVHSYYDAARNNGYTWLHAAVVGIDRDKRVVYTDEGWLTYDYLVMGPGIDYDYAGFGVPDPGDAARLRALYPAAFQPGSEHLTLKNKLEEFDGGTFVLTAPPGNYRCLPAPYERACMIAGYLKENEIEGKVVLLDARETPGFRPDGISKAFRDLYGDYIEHVRGVEITGIDIGRKRIETSKGAIDFTDASIYPPVRGARLLELAGVAGKGGFADIDPISYHVKGDDRVFVGGDARPMPFVKAGFAANFEAQHIARLITNHMDGKDMGPLHSPGIMCYVAVNAEPLQSIGFKISFGWVYDRKTGKPTFTQKAQAFTQRSRALGKANIQWGKGMFREMFYSSL